MLIRWIGHAAFYIETEKGLRIRTDPYDESVGLPVSALPADVATVSHDHFDHNAAHLVPGDPQVLKETGETEAAGVTFGGIESFHDDARGQKRGTNVIFKFTADAVTLAHLGDLGHQLEKGRLDALQGTDIVLLPVGRTYTLDPQGATALIEALRPAVAIPMHYRTPGLEVGISGVEPFLAGKENVTRIRTLDISADTLPPPTQITVLEPRP